MISREHKRKFRYVATSVKPIICKMCGRSFRDEKHALDHYETKHATPKETK